MLCILYVYCLEKYNVVKIRCYSLVSVLIVIKMFNL